MEVSFTVGYPLLPEGFTMSVTDVPLQVARQAGEAALLVAEHVSDLHYGEDGGFDGGEVYEGE